MSDQNNLGDPNGWFHLIAGGLLTAMGKWFWDRLIRSPRPPKSGHGMAYLQQQMTQVIDRLDSIEAKVDGNDARLSRLEARRATAGD